VRDVPLNVRDEVRYIRVVAEMGVRMIHVSYNRQNPLGGGCVEAVDAGLSDFGRFAIGELNRQGVPVRDYPRQLSPAEAEAAQKTASDEARRKPRDSYLLTNYTQVGDIEQLRDERIALIDGQMELARGSIATADQRIGALRNRMSTFKPYSSSANARRLPDQLAEEVVRALSDRRSMATQLEQRAKEKAEQMAAFNSDIARYRELTSRPRSR
jgi:hypothetical protein